MEQYCKNFRIFFHALIVSNVFVGCISLLFPIQLYALDSVLTNTTATPYSSYSTDTSSPKVRYFEITNGSAMVRSALDPEAQVLGIAQKGSSFPLLAESESWCKIRYNESVGWVEQRLGKITQKTPDSSFAAKFPRMVLLVLAVLFVIALISLGIMALVRLLSKNDKTIFIQKSVLIISDREKHVVNALTNTNTTLKSCFAELGFKIISVEDMIGAQRSLLNNLPDLILVDWQISTTIQKQISDLQRSRTSLGNAVVIYFNVQDGQVPVDALDVSNIFYMGVNITDRDIFKVVTPLIITDNRSNRIRKSVNTSALEGDIGDGNLSEVFQFLEIGKKTGVLSILQTELIGAVYFEEGRIVHAATPTKIGRDAVFEILSMPHGHFSFLLDKYAKKNSLNASTLELLMEWAKISDEANRR